METTSHGLQGEVIYQILKPDSQILPLERNNHGVDQKLGQS
jgi:hypothetical protein